MDIEAVIAGASYTVKHPLHHVCETTWQVNDLKLPDYDLWYVHRGRGTIRIDTATYPVHANTLYVFSPGETVSIRQVLPHNITVTLCHFMPTGDNGVFTGRLVIPHQVHIREGAVRRSFADVVQNGESAIARTTFVLGVLSYIVERGKITVKKSTPSGNERYGKLSAMKTYIGSHLESRIGLTDLAGIIGMDRTSVIRIFTEHLHTTPHRYIMQRRMEAAKQLLSEGCPVHAAARRTGFSDSASFVKAFRSLCHTTPGSFREKIDVV
ncbi:MAG: AraC family transcriptional regulator [Spirochaetota bacterium]